MPILELITCHPENHRTAPLNSFKSPQLDLNVSHLKKNFALWAYVITRVLIIFEGFTWESSKISTNANTSESVSWWFSISVLNKCLQMDPSWWSVSPGSEIPFSMTIESKYSIVCGGRTSCNLTWYRKRKGSQTFRWLTKVGFPDSFFYEFSKHLESLMGGMPSLNSWSRDRLVL